MHPHQVWPSDTRAQHRRRASTAVTRWLHGHSHSSDSLQPKPDTCVLHFRGLPFLLYSCLPIQKHSEEQWLSVRKSLVTNTFREGAENERWACTHRSSSRGGQSGTGSQTGCSPGGTDPLLTLPCGGRCCSRRRFTGSQQTTVFNRSSPSVPSAADE